MTSNPPIFILSAERTGSTLLRFILDTHPDIACPGELYLGRLIHDLKVTLGRSLSLTESEDANQRDENARLEVRAYLDKTLSAYAKKRGKRIWCDKTPFNLHNLADIEWAFPDARFICLYRDSLDVIQSCLDVQQRGKMHSWAIPYAVKHKDNFIAAMLESWNSKTELLLSFEKKRSTCRVRYEDLVTDPIKTLDPVFRYLKLDWDTQILEKIFSSHHDLGGGDHKIESTEKIEKERIGLGKNLDPILWALVPLDLKQRRAQLNRHLNYPDQDF